MRPEAVPESLRVLIPLAERWGLPADTARQRAAENATDADRDEIRAALKGHHREIEDWLYALAEGEVPTREMARIQALVLFELEECAGPGLRGWLDYALAVTKENPSEEHLVLLSRAFTFTKSAAQTVGTDATWAAELRAAEKLLREHHRGPA
jgi:hypothetical protein